MRTGDKHFRPGVTASQHLHAAIVFIFIKQRDARGQCSLIRDRLPVAVVCASIHTAQPVAMRPAQPKGARSHSARKQRRSNERLQLGALTAALRLFRTLVERDRSVVWSLPG